ncbi:hypothetical protein PTT_12441 [Pyrenophora teres f. teres 0-1]|uniref:Uncharacterized protein n=1 Tax=Pyrenophora teres f. teres (strain 0-1) TaxID=861557 RepID=E3RTT6_PYRTT|nr:hypothetical protein PTT_12441 [Pyrenophora teres f. teres 0-1]
MVAGPQDDYRGEEAFDSMRRFVLEYALQIDKVLMDIARAEAIVSGKKSWWGVPRMAIVGYEVNKNGRYPAKNKIFYFSLKAEPLFILL